MIRIRPLLSRALHRPRAIIGECSHARSASTKRGRPRGHSIAEADLTPEQREILERYPLARALNTGAGTPQIKPEKVSSGHVRPQIVSPGLCGTLSSPLAPFSRDTSVDVLLIDDVLNYLGSTLDKHKGCDILDINPGAGLWSQKLHDYLKPRSHVLLEPRHDKFKQFLDPLLEAPGSKYKLVQKDPCDLATYNDMIAEGAFPDQVVRSPQDPKAQQVNDTLLVTGSLVWEPRLSGIGFDSMAKQLFHHFATGAGHNDYFHAFGLARTLLWMQTDDYSTMFATSISAMHKANRILEMTHNMTLMVNGQRNERKIGRGSSGREPTYEFESMLRALKAGKAGGFNLPENRRAPHQDFAAEIDRISGGTGITRIGPMQEYLHAQQVAGKSTAGLTPTGVNDLFEMEMALDKKFPDVEMAKLSVLPSDEARLRLQSHPKYDDFKLYLRKRSTVDGLRKIKMNVEACGDIGEAMYHVEAKILDAKDGPKKDALLKELAALQVEWDKALAGISQNHRGAVANDTDERISLRTFPHPRIQWDRRLFEPLFMRPEEVWPGNSLSLISAEPVSRRSADAAHEDAEWVRDFVYGLFNMPAEPIEHALDRMQHGLSSIIKDCPSLRDPRKGGRLNMKHFRVRMLAVDMIHELAAAYKNWPFKAPGSNHPHYYRHKSSTNMGS